jgi:hypothetical protein
MLRLPTTASRGIGASEQAESKLVGAYCRTPLGQRSWDKLHGEFVSKKT